MGLGDRTASTKAPPSGGMGARGSRKKSPVAWLRVLYWLCVLAGIYFAFLNIQPYAQAVAFIGSKSINGVFIHLISIIPIINGIGAFIGASVTWILGSILWGIIQIIEVLPLVLYNHAGFMQSFIGQADSHQKYGLKESDDPTLRMLKRIHNALPTSMITNLERLRIFTYTVDFIICLSVYSPVASGKVTDFFWVLFTGQWGKIDTGNLLLALITLFAIEAIISLIIWIGKLSYAVKSASH